ncbi:MAG: response regulator transcription factor [Treponema sp.]|nr:response regulator transcription factor [Treponema sp.]
MRRTSQTVLAVDDEPKIRDVVKAYLEMEGLRVLCAGSGREGMELFEKGRSSGSPVSLILLDLMLPDFPGEEFCKRVRRVSDVPIIMITAKVGEESVIRGLNIGADDYVCKPFSPRQLTARVQAALRRSAHRIAPGAERGVERSGGCGEAAGNLLSYRGLIVDTEKRIVSRNGKTVGLTRDEYSILTLLRSCQVKIFTREEILEAIKGPGYGGFDRSVDTHIKKLRAKLEDDPRTPEYIITVYGMGYRLGNR